MEISRQSPGEAHPPVSCRSTGSIRAGAAKETHRHHRPFPGKLADCKSADLEETELFNRELAGFLNEATPG